MTIKSQRESGDNELFITLVPNVFLFVGSTNLGTLLNFDLLSVYNFSTINFNLQKRYHQLGCKSNYRVLYYPFRSLIKSIWVAIIISISSKVQKNHRLTTKQSRLQSKYSLVIKKREENKESQKTIIDRKSRNLVISFCCINIGTTYNVNCRLNAPRKGVFS